MKREKFKKLLEDRVLFLDGAYGTEFIKKGYKEDLFEILNIKNPDIVKELHKKYVDSASDILITNTFSANRHKLYSYGLQDEFTLINENAVKIARSAGNVNTIIFGDIGPIGSQIEPFGNITFLQALKIFKEQADILIKTGVDGIILETFSDIKELKAAILAIKELDDDIPIIANMTFTENGISITGSSVENFAIIINDLDVDVAGINCTLGPEQILSIFNQLSLFCKKPLCIEPNAGIPQYIDGNLYYNIDPVKFAIYSKNIVEIGANIVGGCCGTGPEHIKAMVEFVGNKKPKKREIPERQYLSSRTILNSVEPFLIIGEKINASAKKKFASEDRE